MKIDWNSIDVHPEGPLFRRIDSAHPLDFYLGKSIEGKCVFLLVSKARPNFSSALRAMELSCGQRSDGRWALTFTLNKAELLPIFSQMCWDLVESSRTGVSPDGAASFVVDRFNAWQRLLQKAPSGMLELSALRGLTGELLYLEYSLTRRSHEESIHAWKGPCGACQDFQFSDVAAEVKTIYPGAREIKISSAEQLTSLGKPLHLAVYHLEDCSPEQEEPSFSIVELVSRLRDLLASDASILVGFEKALLEAGFLDSREYDKIKFRLMTVDLYLVSNAFPALRAFSIPAGVSNVSYDVSLSAIRSFAIPF